MRSVLLFRLSIVLATLAVSLGQPNALAAQSAVEELVKACASEIDVELRPVISGLSQEQFESAPTPPNWRAYGNPEDRDHPCRNFLYVEITGAQRHNVLITPGAALTQLAKRNIFECTHSHIFYGVFGRLRLPFGLGLFGFHPPWVYIAGGGLAGLWNGHECVGLTSDPVEVTRHFKNPPFTDTELRALAGAFSLFGTDQVAIENNPFDRIVVAVQAQSHYTAGCLSEDEMRICLQSPQGGCNVCLHQVKLTASSEPRFVLYTVSVQTGNIANAGTDARVFLRLFGGGMSEFKELDNPRRDDTERGRTDMFTFSSVELENLTQLQVFHDNSRKTPGWYVETIKVKNLSSGKEWTFPIDRWLARDACDGQISLVLTPNTLPPAPGRNCRRN